MPAMNYSIKSFELEDNIIFKDVKDHMKLINGLIYEVQENEALQNKLKEVCTQIVNTYFNESERLDMFTEMFESDTFEVIKVHFNRVSFSEGVVTYKVYADTIAVGQPIEIVERHTDPILFKGDLPAYKTQRLMCLEINVMHDMFNNVFTAGMVGLGVDISHDCPANDNQPTLLFNGKMLGNSELPPAITLKSDYGSIKAGVTLKFNANKFCFETDNGRKGIPADLVSQYCSEVWPDLFYDIFEEPEHGGPLSDDEFFEDDVEEGFQSEEEVAGALSQYLYEKSGEEEEEEEINTSIDDLLKSISKRKKDEK